MLVASRASGPFRSLRPRPIHSPSRRPRGVSAEVAQPDVVRAGSGVPAIPDLAVSQQQHRQQAPGPPQITRALLPARARSGRLLARHWAPSRRSGHHPQQPGQPRGLRTTQVGETRPKVSQTTQSGLNRLGMQPPRAAAVTTCQLRGFALGHSTSRFGCDQRPALMSDEQDARRTPW